MSNYRTALTNTDLRQLYNSYSYCNIVQTQLGPKDNSAVIRVFKIPRVILEKNVPKTFKVGCQWFHDQGRVLESRVGANLGLKFRSVLVCVFLITASCLFPSFFSRSYCTFSYCRIATLMRSAVDNLQIVVQFTCDFLTNKVINE